MTVGRREVVAGGLALALSSGTVLARTGDRHAMFGLIGKMRAVAGERDALIALLLEGTDAMPGCLSYIVAKDPADADGIWITEVWDRRESHAASLQLPSVRATIARARPLIVGFENGTETEPVGGVGLPR
jgi:quinol monooxygenase YgiN